MVDERLREIVEESAWIVGGAVRDELVGRPVLDVDVACGEPRDAAIRFARRFGGAAFPLSERHGAWRVASPGSDATVDFTPLPDGIEADLATRDFTLNAIAVPAWGGDAFDPHEGRGDLDAGILRAVSDTVFVDDPLRLLRAIRLEDELGVRMDARTEELLRESALLAGRPSGERILAELSRLSAAAFRRLDELDLLEPLGGALDDRLDVLDDADFRLVAVFGAELERYPISNDLRRYASTLLEAERPADPSPRTIHRFRRATEPWAVDALFFVGAPELVGVVELARGSAPSEPLVRGDELGLAPGPEIGRILALIEEERAAGTISTRDEALALARSQSGEASP